MNLLTMEHVSKAYTDRVLLDDVGFGINKNEKIGVIGVNGMGKSTLLKIVAGIEESDAGTISMGNQVKICYLPQTPVFEAGTTILRAATEGNYDELNRWTIEAEAKSMLNQLGFTDYAEKIEHMSGGQKKRVALVRALLTPADILVLDEPTNHLDNEMSEWLEEYLIQFRGAILMVTHDRYFLDSVTNRIVELDKGKLYSYQGGYEKYLELKAERLSMAEAAERKRQSILRVEREWIMRGCRARTTKSRDRIERYEALKNQDAPETDDTVQMAAASSRLGKKLIELHDVSKSYEGRTVIRDFSYNLLRNDRIGIVGHNGAGKSTLLRLFAGELSPDSGTVDIGTTVKIGHFSQEGRELDLNQRVYDFIHDIGDEVRTDEGTFTAKAMMERFLFPSDLQSVPIGRLSGGERRRLYLLSILMEAPNVLLLDEPTNDLDVMTLSILEDYLQGFPGPILIVSHDRFLLDKLAEQVFEVRDGQVLRYSGNWSDWKAKRKEEEAPAKAEKPKAAQERPRERKLKFSFKEQREFETIDADLAALEQQIKDCEAAQSACGSDYVKLQELQARQAELEAALEEKTERWMYLTELKEKIDAQ